MNKPKARLDFGSIEDVSLPKPNEEQVRAAAKAVGFQPTNGAVQANAAATEQPSNVRRTRRKTGRVHLFSTRLKIETVDAIHAYADAHDITLAEVLERAVASLSAER
ncbi:stability/partitioning determinant [Aureimonas sp. AU12]|uniref:stability/partitioning determinant n=1 Tax=Aureimonas sp. AU12 TaxID=1638161 RepID=UPI0012E3D1C1|nr:stability/partitioning determinant [Aureimonas sp. AU12]